MKKNVSRLFALLLALVFVASSFATAAFAAPEAINESDVLCCAESEEYRTLASTKGAPYGTSIWLTGCFKGNAWSTSHRFVIKSTSATPKFKVYTYNANGNSTSGRFSIRVTTPQDSSYVRTYYGKSNGDTISLNKGYSLYNIQIRRYGTGSTNVANCYYWAFKATSRNSGWDW